MINFKDLFKNKKIKYLLYLAVVIVLVLSLKVKNIKEEIKKPAISPIPTEIISPPTATTVIPSPLTTTFPSALGNPDFYESQKPVMVKKYPLFDYTPHKSENFYINYLKPLTLKIILKQDTPEARQEVLEWIKSKGVDPGTHQIIWKTP